MFFSLQGGNVNVVSRCFKFLVSVNNLFKRKNVKQPRTGTITKLILTQLPVHTVIPKSKYTMLEACSTGS